MKSNYAHHDTMVNNHGFKYYRYIDGYFRILENKKAQWNTKNYIRVCRSYNKRKQ